MWRARLGSTRLGQDRERHLLLITFHHIAADGWSVDVFFAELAALYGAFVQHLPPALPALPLQVREFAAWQRAHFLELAPRVAERRAQLADLPRTELAPELPRGPLFDSRGELVTTELPAGQIDGLRVSRPATTPRFSRRCWRPFFAFFAQRTGATDLAVGITTSGRDRPETEVLIGFFVNTLVVRVDLSGEPDFGGDPRPHPAGAAGGAGGRGAVREAGRGAQSAMRDPSRPVLVSNFFQVFEGNLDLELPGLACRTLDPWTGTAKFETDWAVLERDGRYMAELECSAGLFTREAAEELLQAFLNLAADAAAAPQKRLAELGKAAPELPRPAAKEDVAVPEPAADEPALRPARRDGLERRLSALWSELLQVAHVGLDDNFFDLGGHSLLMPRLLIELEPTWPDLAVLDFFRHPTVRTLAAHLRTLVGGRAGRTSPPSPTGEGETPLWPGGFLSRSPSGEPDWGLTPAFAGVTMGRPAQKAARDGSGRAHRGAGGAKPPPFSSPLSRPRERGRG